MGTTTESLREVLPDLPNGCHCSETPESAFEAQRFWTVYRPWLADRGYTLFDMVIGKEFVAPYWIPPLAAVSAPVPYAFCHLDMNKPVSPWLMSWVETRFAFAQDTQGRNIAIKVIESDSEEEKIYEHLLHCTELFDPEAFANVLPPWGDLPFLKDIKTVREVMDFMVDMLRDIAHTNLMINCFIPTHYLLIDKQRPLLEKYRSSSQARYCLFDFNLSKRFPLGLPIESYHSQSTEAFIGWESFHPRDVYQGEFEYNPFAFDVACLGNLLMFRFADVIPTVNMLAPLFDRMTTHIISQRFTAAQAFSFCREIMQSMSEEELDASVCLFFYGPSEIATQDCWDRVPNTFATLWSRYRSPAVSKTIRFLHWLCSFESGGRFVRYIRKTFRI